MLPATNSHLQAAGELNVVAQLEQLLPLAGWLAEAINHFLLGWDVVAHCGMNLGKLQLAAVAAGVAHSATQYAAQDAAQLLCS